MTVKSNDGRIALQGRCRVEDAEPLLAELQRNSGSVVDLEAAETLHSAVVQVLLAAKPRIVGLSKTDFLARYGLLESG